MHGIPRKEYHAQSGHECKECCLLYIIRPYSLSVCGACSAKGASRSVFADKRGLKDDFVSGVPCSIWPLQCEGLVCSCHDSDNTMHHSLLACVYSQLKFFII